MTAYFDLFEALLPAPIFALWWAGRVPVCGGYAVRAFCRAPFPAPDEASTVDLVVTGATVDDVVEALELLGYAARGETKEIRLASSPARTLCAVLFTRPCSPLSFSLLLAPSSPGALVQDFDGELFEVLYWGTRAAPTGTPRAWRSLYAQDVGWKAPLSVDAARRAKWDTRIARWGGGSIGSRRPALTEHEG